MGTGTQGLGLTPLTWHCPALVLVGAEGPPSSPQTLPAGDTEDGLWLQLGDRDIMVRGRGGHWEGSRGGLGGHWCVLGGHPGGTGGHP